MINTWWYENDLEELSIGTDEIEKIARRILNDCAKQNEWTRKEGGKCGYGATLYREMAIARSEIAEDVGLYTAFRCDTDGQVREVDFMDRMGALIYEGKIA